MGKIILSKSNQKRILKIIKKEVLSSLASQSKNISEIRVFGSILRWEFGHIPNGKATSSGIRYWSDIDFLIIVKDNFKPPSSWKEKFKTKHNYWFCYHLPKGIRVKLEFQGKIIKPAIPVAFAVINENTIEDPLKKKQSVKDGLPLIKGYIRIY